jgi:hypothetical protein
VANLNVVSILIKSLWHMTPSAVKKALSEVEILSVEN